MRLTSEEEKGYKRDDSLARVEAAKELQIDSASQNIQKKFNPFHLLGGGEYYFGKGLSSGFYANASKIGYNSVEGFKFGLSGYLRYRKREKLPDSIHYQTRVFQISPKVRYGFSSKQPYSRIALFYNKGYKNSSSRLGMEAGRFIFG